jgi:hypothetical protein
MAGMTANTFLFPMISPDQAKFLDELFEHACGDVFVRTSFAVFKNYPSEQRGGVIRK